MIAYGFCPLFPPHKYSHQQEQNYAYIRTIYSEESQSVERMRKHEKFDICDEKNNVTLISQPNTVLLSFFHNNTGLPMKMLIFIVTSP